jgi:hypothetical protein
VGTGFIQKIIVGIKTHRVLEYLARWQHVGTDDAWRRFTKLADRQSGVRFRGDCTKWLAPHSPGGSRMAPAANRGFLPLREMVSHWLPFQVQDAFPI